MQIVDTALKARQEENNPVRVGLIGAGFMGRGITNQIVNYVTGMTLVAISNRTIAHAQHSFEKSGISDAVVVNTLAELNGAIEKGQYAVTEDAELLCQANNIDVLIESTGHVEFGAYVILNAFENGKHVVSMNA